MTNEQYQNSGNRLVSSIPGMTWESYPPQPQLSTLLPQPITVYPDTIEFLLKRIEELERRLGINSLEMGRLVQPLAPVPQPMMWSPDWSGELQEAELEEVEDEEPKVSRKFRKVTEETK